MLSFSQETLNPAQAVSTNRGLSSGWRPQQPERGNRSPRSTVWENRFSPRSFLAALTSKGIPTAPATTVSMAGGGRECVAAATTMMPASTSGNSDTASAARDSVSPSTPQRSRYPLGCAPSEERRRNWWRRHRCPAKDRSPCLRGAGWWCCRRRNEPSVVSASSRWGTGLAVRWRESSVHVR